MSDVVYDGRCKHGAVLAYRCGDCLTERLAQVERTATAAERRIGEWATTAERLRTERDAALAKAEAAEKEIQRLEVVVEDEIAAHGDICARIEALAKSWVRIDTVHVGRDYALALFALLQSPKAETALDVLSRIEKAMPNWRPIPEQLADDMAKLRALLEEKK